jgi:hypothetical protein
MSWRRFFGKSAGAIEQFSKTANKQFGLTELQAKQFSSTLGAVFKGMGVSDDFSLQMSTGLAARAGDIASLYNLDINDAFGKIKSGIVGQTEPLNSVGVVMTQENLKNFAVSKGIETAVDKMDAAQKAMLRFQFIMEKSAIAAGDFAKPIDSWAVSSRQLKSNIEALGGQIAGVFLPALIGIANRVNNFVIEYGPVIVQSIKDVWDLISDLWPAIVMTAGSLVILKGAIIIGDIIDKAVVAMGLLKASIIAQHLPVNALTLDHAALSAAMTANPIGLILIAFIALVAGIAAIVKYATGDVMTWGESIMVAIQNVNRAIGIILNPIYDFVQEVLTFPKWFGFAASQAMSDGMDAFQDKINIMTTGTTNRFSEGYGLLDFGGGDILKMAKERAEKGGGDDVKSEIISEMEKLLEELMKTTAAVYSLKDAPKSIPGQLNYSQMRIGDVWDIARRG